MAQNIKFNLDEIKNIKKTINSQITQFNDLRKLVRNLKFIPVDSISTYSSVSYKSIDGGKMGISFHPFEFDFIVIADSMENELMRYLVPKSDSLTPSDFIYMDRFSEIKQLLTYLNVDSIVKISDFLMNPKIAMELTEFACIFDRIRKIPTDPIIIMKDGLLRTKAINYEHIPKMISVLKQFKKRKLIGVAKNSQVLNLLSTALHVEGIIPSDYTGFVEIPWELEALAYKQSKAKTHLYYAFGKLYIAKLSKKSNLLVTVEIPYDFKNNEEIYTKNEIYEIIGHLIRDSRGSYPILGYPQTIMRAHERAVRTGFSASIWRDKIIDRILEEIDDDQIKNLIHESHFLREYVKKGMLGGL
ncbi:MAG: hypothetical protein GF311_06420 [Candidatus Lokiarchaeota archaeon]|nr:hypothetical protein [Candidatus Lokiarchaeota archaeon]